MTALICLAAWSGATLLIAWAAGRFIRAGIVDLQHQDAAREEV